MGMDHYAAGFRAALQRFTKHAGIELSFVGLKAPHSAVAKAIQAPNFSDWYEENEVQDAEGSPLRWQYAAGGKPFGQSVALQEQHQKQISDLGGLGEYHAGPALSRAQALKLVKAFQDEHKGDAQMQQHAAAVRKYVTDLYKNPQVKSVYLTT